MSKHRVMVAQDGGSFGDADENGPPELVILTVMLDKAEVDRILASMAVTIGGLLHPDDAQSLVQPILDALVAKIHTP